MLSSSFLQISKYNKIKKKAFSIFCKEKVVIPKNKEYIFLRGNGKGRMAIVWNDGSNDNSESATLTIHANNFVAFGIIFKNDAPLSVKDKPYDQSVAATVSGDRVAFYHCAFLSPHNTLFDRKERHYYESCYIQGNIDFIFGRGRSIFQSCEIFVLADQRTEILGSITAQNMQSAKEKGGFVFLGEKYMELAVLHRSCYSRLPMLGSMLLQLRRSFF